MTASSSHEWKDSITADDWAVLKGNNTTYLDLALYYTSLYVLHDQSHRTSPI
jgi:hypothetical protein